MSRARTCLGAAVAVSACLIGCTKPMPPEPEVKTTMELKSSSFATNQAIPAKYSSYGANVSPELTWTKPPEGTKSLVLLVEDPDAPKPQPFVHWLVYDIPATDSSSEEGLAPSGGTVGKNDNGTVAYFGPKPPSGTHHYHFRLYAVDKKLGLPAGTTKDQVLKQIDGHTLGQAEMIATFSH
jgi:Raf kinase inhibitor-like YbhB/YbcL family protein